MTGCGQKGPLYRSEPVPDYVWSPSAKDDGKKRPSPFSHPAPQTQKHDQASPGTNPPPTKDAAAPSDGAVPDPGNTTPESPSQP